MSRDDLDQIPSIVPTREGAPSRGNRRGRGQPDRRRGAPPPAKGGAGILARLFITASLAAAGVACAWAWQLQMQLEQADQRLLGYAGRIGDLEARLSDTDEGMTQNAAAQAVKLRELDSEVRKLWDNVWKRSKQRLDKLEAASSKQGESIDKMQGTVGSVKSDLDAAFADITRLKSVAGDLSRLMASAKANQAEVERVADTLNRIDLDLAKLAKRVQENEEWVGSMNASRRQINAQVEDLQAALSALQQAP
jgi:chromosome segregation ATPase